MRDVIKNSLAYCLVFTLLTQSLFANELPIYRANDIVHPTRATFGMIAVANQYAAKAGLDVLKEGGNAVDAAVTVAFVLAVTSPQAGNLGGGGFMLVHDAESGETKAIDYREKAPILAHKDLFLNEFDELDVEKTRYSFLASGVPGTVAGLSLALKTFGTISLKKALLPAIKLAQDGFKIDEQLYFALKAAQGRMKNFEYSYATFYKDNGEPYGIGETLVQKDLAWTLKQLYKYGETDFYSGAIAKKITDTMRTYGGLITDGDLNNYDAVIRAPVKGTYRGYDIYSMPPPSSGGIHLIQILNIIEEYPLNTWGHNSAKSIHVLTEAMKQAFADRSEFLGDPDFISIPVTGLTSKQYASETRDTIQLNKARPSKEVKPSSTVWNYDGHETNHFSIVDRYGNAVSNTYTLNFAFGSKLSVPGAGFLLNNEMDDFASKAGIPNAYGLIGSKANEVAPNKRMLSSMSPTIVMKNGKPFIITGSPGGSRIISTVTQIISNVIDYNMNIAEATYAPRIHHQWIPDQLYIEHGISKDTLDLLIKKGHDIKEGPSMGSAQSILIENDIFHGVTDPRIPGSVVVGY